MAGNSTATAGNSTTAAGNSTAFAGNSTTAAGNSTAPRVQPQLQTAAPTVQPPAPAGTVTVGVSPPGTLDMKHVALHLLTYAAISFIRLLKLNKGVALIMWSRQMVLKRDLGFVCLTKACQL